MLILRDVIEKLKDVLSDAKKGNKKKVFDKDVALALNISPTTFATMKKRNSIPYEEILAFCAIQKISVNWLFFDQNIDMLKEQTDKFFQIHYFPEICASAGGGAEVLDEAYETMRIDAKFIPSMKDSDHRQLEAIHVDGDSMYPTLLDGSIVFIDRRNTDISQEGIFVASTTAGLFIKRIGQRNETIIELLSDNRAYAPEILASDEVSILGKVVGSIESL